MRRKDKEFYPRMNRIMEGLAKASLSENDGKYCWALFRKTFGYGEYEYKISRDKFEEMTGISGCHVSRTKKRLLDRRIIFCNNKSQGFNLDIEAWKKVPVAAPFKKVPVAAQKGADRAEKKGTGSGTHLSTKRKKVLKKGGGVSHMTEKEVQRLKDIEELKEDMIEKGFYKEKVFNSLVSKHKIAKLWSIWNDAIHEGGIRDPIGYMINKLMGGREL